VYLSTWNSNGATLCLSCKSHLMNLRRNYGTHKFLRGANNKRIHNVTSLFFHRACCYRILFKIPTHALCFKIHTNTQSLFKTLECLNLLCHPTCFSHILDHLQRMFLVQCYFPPCCFVIHDVTFHEGIEWEQWYSYMLSLTSTLDGAGWLTPRHGSFSPGNDPIPSA